MKETLPRGWARLGEAAEARTDQKVERWHCVSLGRVSRPGRERGQEKN